MAVSDHQAMAVLAEFVGEGGNLLGHLSLQGNSQHPPGSIPTDFIQHCLAILVAGIISDYTQRRRFLTHRRITADVSDFFLEEGYAALISRVGSTTFGYSSQQACPRYWLCVDYQAAFLVEPQTFQLGSVTAAYVGPWDARYHRTVSAFGPLRVSKI